MSQSTSELPPIDYQWIVRGFIRTFAVGALVMGLAMIAGGPVRFSGPSFATARLVPGGVYSWGAVIALGGLITLVGILGRWRRRVVAAGLYLQAAWFVFFVISLATVTIESPTGGVTGPIIYTMVGTIAVTAAVGGRSIR